MLAIVNGTLVSKQDAVVSISDRGLLLGDGLFETMCFTQKKILFFEEHWQRLNSSLAKMLIPIPFDKNQLKANIYQLITAEQGLNEQWIIRLTVTRGESQRGINLPVQPLPNYFITIAAWSKSKQDVKLIISSNRRNEYSFITQIKSLNYLDNILARHEAELSGADDALFLNSQEFITESTVANFFVVIDGVIGTPPISDGLVPGIMRKFILQAAACNGLLVQEASFKTDDLQRASEIFLTNIAIGIQRVGSIKPYFSANKIQFFNILNQLYIDYIQRHQNNFI